MEVNVSNHPTHKEGSLQAFVLAAILQVLKTEPSGFSPWTLEGQEKIRAKLDKQTKKRFCEKRINNVINGVADQLLCMNRPDEVVLTTKRNHLRLVGSKAA